MAFFSITRYDTEDTSESKAKRSDILKGLHAKAESRRKSLGIEHVEEKAAEEVSSASTKFNKSTSEHLTDTDVSTEPSSTPKKKRKHNKKKADDTLTELKEAGQQSVETEESEIKPLKRKHTGDEGDSEPKKRKRKRKQKKCDQEKDEVGADISRKDNTETSEQKNKDDREFMSDQEEKDGISENADQNKTKGQKHSKVGGFTVIGEVEQVKSAKVERVLPAWLSHPSVITDDLRRNRTPLDSIKGLDPHLVKKLQQHGIKDFFPVQSQLLPALLTTDKTGYILGDSGFRPPDMCCSAPTGSGKTLAYVLPIVQTLLGRVVPQIRALVVLPVRELVQQVYKVFQNYTHGTSLKVGQIVGQRSFTNEQNSLVKLGPRGYTSLVDILVTTPGRLVDHINTTPGFNLRHLRFLVIDEADRMMEEIKQDWLSNVENAVYKSADKMEIVGSSEASLLHCRNKIYGEIYRPQPGPLTAHNMTTPTIPLQKLLFSATLSQNPEKLEQLRLFQPRLFTSVVGRLDVDGETAENKALNTATGRTKGDFVGKYTTPAGLTEFYIESSTAEKPLVLMYLIHHLKFRHILCFTNSVEATHRLYLLLRLTCDVEIREFSSQLPANKRSRIIKQFSQGKIDVMICTDAMARGLDIAGVKYVMSYDAPRYLKTYVHRSGRTARAGKAGTAVTFLETKKVKPFKKMIEEAGKNPVEELNVDTDMLEPFVETYKEALTELQDILQRESRS